MACTRVGTRGMSLLLPLSVMLLAVAPLEKAAARLTVASITPDPAPSGTNERLTIHMEGVTEEHLAGPRNSLRLRWPTSNRTSHTQAVVGWPTAGSAPADGKVSVILDRNTEIRWPTTGPIEVRVRAEYNMGSLGWLAIATADCVHGTVGACTIAFADAGDQNATTPVRALAK